MAVLENITSPSDIKKLNIDQQKELAEEIRKVILEVAKTNGGHLASNLGIVETTIALYNAFDFSKDKLIFDVGHQCYAHKILSGRNKEFSSIRTLNGISGFPDIKESVYDAFGSGHAGTSISAGLGFCTARDKLEKDYYVITIVGDGALVNGVNWEAISSSNSKPKKHIVILNDNGMSISKNKNGFYKYISKETAKRSYIASKRRFLKLFSEKSFITRAVVGIRDFIKRVIKKSDYFENHGFKYVGVVDGNDLSKLNKILKDVKYACDSKAVFLHIKTTKGKGFNKAEQDAESYHGVGASLKNDMGDFAVGLGNTLCSIIENDNRVVALTAGMKDGTGLVKVEQKFPQNFFDVGIAEEFAVTYAAGMAAGGLKPVVAIYSTFMQRAYDQILHDICLQNLPVVFCLDRAGAVGRDGKTHQGIYDLSYLSHLPNMTILAPNSVSELDDMVKFALSLNSPVAIRYPKNAGSESDFVSAHEEKCSVIKEGKKVNLLAVGPKMKSLALEVAKDFVDVGVISVKMIKPLDSELLLKIKDSYIITLEENVLVGGFGWSVCAFYNDMKINAKITNLGFADKPLSHGEISEQLELSGLSKENLKRLIEQHLSI